MLLYTAYHKVVPITPIQSPGDFKTFEHLLYFAACLVFEKMATTYIDGSDPTVHEDYEYSQNQLEASFNIDPLASEQFPVQYESFRALLRPAAAEFLGSAIFIFVACGAGMTTVNYQAVGNITIGIALTFGFTIFVVAFMIGHISGAHLNFSITFTFALLRRISILKCILYFLAQFTGGLVGIGFLKLITPLPWWKSCFAANFVHPGLTVGHAFFAEMILTFFLVFVVMAACDSTKSNQIIVPFAIGMAVFSAHMIGLPITGCSMNPTRSFASAAAASGVAGCDPWSPLWIFWIAPLLGGPIAGFVYSYVFEDGGAKIDSLVDQYVLRKNPLKPD